MRTIIGGFVIGWAAFSLFLCCRYYGKAGFEAEKLFRQSPELRALLASAEPARLGANCEQMGVKPPPSLDADAIEHWLTSNQEEHLAQVLKPIRGVQAATSGMLLVFTVAAFVLSRRPRLGALLPTAAGPARDTKDGPAAPVGERGRPAR